MPPFGINPDILHPMMPEDIWEFLVFGGPLLPVISVDQLVQPYALPGEDDPSRPDEYVFLQVPQLRGAAWH